MVVGELRVRRWVKTGLLLVMLLSVSVLVEAQKQLVLLKGENVIARFYPGDDFIYRVKGSSKIQSSYINNLYDTAIMTGDDTVAFYKIAGVRYKRSTFGKRLVTLIFVGAVGYLFIDQFNEVVVHGNKPSFRLADRVSVGTGAGATPVTFIKRKIVRIKRRHHFMMVQKGSYFYKENPKGYSSPYIPE